MKLKEELYNSYIYLYIEKRNVFKKKTVGYLGINIIEGLNEAMVERFAVRESLRNSGIGRLLLENAIDRLANYEVDHLIVYPNSEPFEGESFIENRDLYHIYEHLGFNLVNESCDLDIPNNKMLMYI